jgi:uncharacterized peroxidase-related enzyme
MSFIRTVPPAAAPAQVAAMYRRQQDSLGYVPNYAKAFSHRPELMARWAAMFAEIKRPLPRRRVLMLSFVSALELGHSSCSLAHGQMLRDFFSDAEILAIAEGRLEALPAAEQAMLRFARQVARDARAVTADDVETLTSLGFSDAEVFDIAAVAAARAFFTKLLDALGVLPDASLAQLPTSLRRVLGRGRPIDPHPGVGLPAEEPASQEADLGS